MKPIMLGTMALRSDLEVFLYTAKFPLPKSGVENNDIPRSLSVSPDNISSDH